MSNVSRGLGALLAVGATNIGTVTKIGSPSMKRDAIDVTTLAAVNGFKSFIAGLADPGTFSVEGFFDTADAGQMLLSAKFAASTVDTYTVTFPAVSGASWTASCFVKELDLGTESDTTKAIPFKATFQISGAPTFGSSATAGISAMTLTGSAGALSPSFNNAVYAYSYTFTTATSITITPTCASQQYTMYIDGVSQGTVNSGSVSAAIPTVAIGASHRIDLIVTQAGYTPLTYTLVVAKTA